jgi:hypothetical protein
LSVRGEKMNDNKKFIIGVIAIVVIIIGLIIYYFGMNSKSGFVKNNTTNQNTTTQKVTRNLATVNDYQEFFNTDKLVNNYYENMVMGESNVLLNLLDNDYKKNNKIDDTTIDKIIEKDYRNISFYSKTMYVKGINNVEYYFVNGEVEYYDSEYFVTVKEKDFLVIIDKNNGSYSITPLEVSNLLDYSQKYNMLDSKSIKNVGSNDYSKKKYTDELISQYYISYYQMLLYIDSERAYNMLSSTSKSKYPTLEEFVDKLDVIYTSLSTNLTGYSAKGDTGKRTYSVVTKNDVTIEFEESSIMNFKVTI